MLNIFKNKKLNITILLALIIICAAGGVKYYIVQREINQTCRQFFENICQNDFKEAKTLCTGEVLWRIANISDGNASNASKAQIIDWQVNDFKQGNKWASITVTSEIKLANGGITTSFYDVKLTKDHEWLIYSITPIDVPLTKGLTIGTAPDDKDKMDKIMRDYLKTASVDYLVGQARLSQEKAGFTYKPLQSIEDMKSELTYKNKKAAIQKVEYRSNSRLVKLVVTFYKTSTGWKIANIYPA